MRCIFLKFLFKEQMDFNGWTEETKKVAKRWSRNAIIRKWLHYQSALFYQHLDRWIGIPAIFFTSAVAVSLLGSGVTTDDPTTVMVINFICAGVAFVSAGMQGVHIYLDAGGLSQKHLQSSVLYDSVYHDVEIETALPLEDRQDWRWFMAYIDKRYTTTAKVAPVIPGRYFQYNTSEIVYGKLAEELHELDLNDETPIGAGDENNPSNTSEENSLGASQNEYVAGLRLQQEIQMELAKVREKQKLAREEFQCNRLFNGKPMIRPRVTGNPSLAQDDHPANREHVEEVIVEMPETK
jgi:hypothetical protein